MMSKKKKRILMLLENSGMPEDSRVRNEAISLVKHGFEVTVVCPNPKRLARYEQYEGMHLYRYPAPFEFEGFLGYVWEFGYSLVLGFLFSLYVWLRRGFDAIHVHSPPDMNCLVAIFFKLFAFKKFVLDTHDLSPELYDAQKGGAGNKLVKSVLIWFERLAVRWADRLITTNESQRAVQIKRCCALPSRCHVVRNGPNESFTKIAKRTDALPDDGRTIIGYVGMIGFQDGVDSMIRSLSQLKTEYDRENFLGVIIGDGPALASLKELTEQLGLEDHIVFTGLIPFKDVPAHIAAFDVCVTPDPSNPYNDSCTTIKMMEYMAQAKPTVSFETPENRITALEAGIYAADNSESDLARCIAELMDSPSQRAAMGEFGRQRVLKHLAWKHQEKELVWLYNSLFGLASLASRPASTLSDSGVVKPMVEVSECP